jgi:hypothetical protein
MRSKSKAPPTNDENIRLMVKELDGYGIGRFAVNTLSAYAMKPIGWTKPIIDVPYPKGVPPKSLMIKIADASYEVSPPKDIEGWKLIKYTRTLKFYKKDNVILVGVRGTADGRDFMADLKIASGSLSSSSRYKEDLATINSVFEANKTATFYGVGHSLGGAIMDLLIQAGYISRGISYNPAVEKAFFNSTRNYRIYMENDPLYNLIGQYSRLGEVRRQEAVSGYDAIGTAQSARAHLLSNFEGGGIIDDIKHIFKPASKYNNSATKTLKDFGGCKIEKMVVMRTPLQTFVDKALKLLSFGKFNPKKYGFDQLFHTALLASVVCENGDKKVIVIEKNEVLNITTKFKVNSKSQKVEVPIPANYKTLQEFMDTAEKSVSPKIFFQYDPFKNNCQDFMKLVLTANGLYTPTLGKFINQDLTKLVADNAGIGKFSKGVTDFAGIVSRVRGKGDDEMEGGMVDYDEEDYLEG